MSFHQGKVVTLILQERFGSVVAVIGELLFHNPSSLYYLRKTSQLALFKIKESLSILIKYNLASFKLNQDETTATYILQADNVMLMLRYPKYINLIKHKFDDETEILAEEILLNPFLTASELILKTVVRLKENQNLSVLVKQIKDKFTTLVTAQYLMRVLSPNTTEKQLFTIPEINSQQIIEVINGGNEKFGDAGIYWRLNLDRFHQDLRDQVVADAVSNKFDDNMGELMRVLLQEMYIRTAPWGHESNPIPILEVKNIIKKQNTHPTLLTYFDQYVTVLEQDNSGLIQKVGEASGGSFQINMKGIFTKLAWEAVEHIVNEKLDSKAARIFRLIRSKNYIEPDQIQNLVMIPAKEAKKISYQLLEENFVLLNELKRSLPNLGPCKSFTLFFIHLNQIVRSTLELCYKSLFNIMTRRHHEKYLNKRLLDKKQRVDTITHGMRVQGISGEPVLDIEEMITPPENEVLEKIGKMMKQLSTAELEIDNTMFLLQMYLVYE